MTTRPISTAARPSAGTAAHHIDVDAGPPPPLVRASVCAGGTTTNYHRAGTGNLIVLLGTSFLEPTHEPLVAMLARQHRVIVPDLPLPRPVDGGPAVAFSSWLRSFLDGLGAGEISIIARDDHALAALAFALTETDRVTRLVLSFRDAADPLDPSEPLAERLEEARCRLLIVRESPEPGEHDARDARHHVVAQFLAT